MHGIGVKLLQNTSQNCVLRDVSMGRVAELLNYHLMSSRTNSYEINCFILRSIIDGANG